MFYNNNYGVGTSGALNRIYSDGTLPRDTKDVTYSKVGGDVKMKVTDSKGNSITSSIRGVTIPISNNKYDIYLFKAAFASRYQLYLTMGHELMHVRMGFAGLSASYQHMLIYRWEYNVVENWNESSYSRIKPTLGQYYGDYEKYETMSLAPVYKPQDWINLVNRANTFYDCYSFPVGVRSFPVW